MTSRVSRCSMEAVERRRRRAAVRTGARARAVRRLPRVDAPERSSRRQDLARRRGLLERAVHDLRNPLAVVRASVEWLEVELAPPEDSEALDALRDASAATLRALAILDDLEVLAGLEAGRSFARVHVVIDDVV